VLIDQSWPILAAAARRPQSDRRRSSHHWDLHQVFFKAGRVVGRPGFFGIAAVLLNI